MPADNTAIAPVHTTPAPDIPGHDPRLGDDPLGDRIAALCAHIDAATHRLLTLLRVYDEEGRWQGCRSCAHWLSWRTGLSLGPAREKVRVARCLPSLPLISAAFARGEISYSKVRALTRAATTGNEAELLTFARHGTTAHVERLVREWRRLGGSGACPDDPANQTDQGDPTDRRGLSLHLGDDGNYEIRGQLTPEVGALLLKALEATEDKLYREQRAAGTEHEITAAQRRADAFGLWLEEHVQPKVQLVVHSLTAAFPARVSGETSLPHMEAPSLVTEDGCRVSAETSSRLCCDAEVVPIARGTDGSVLDVGRSSRTVGWRLRKALEARDGGCRFPGCGSRVRTHAHHITHWAHGGATAMDNLVLLCPFHHRTVHEGGWRVEMDERGVPNFFNPLGVRMPVAPAPPDIGGLVSGDGAAPPSQDFGLARWHGQADVSPSEGGSLWQGEHIDWGWAMVCLWGEGGGSGAGDGARSA
ncbi:MAG: DUF222 domain-containing protein [Gemmatimonadota bacterium]|nr:DUF222 domain-containing protein [Gemmatimonadota bacterium]